MIKVKEGGYYVAVSDYPHKAYRVVHVILIKNRTTCAGIYQDVENTLHPTAPKREARSMSKNPSFFIDRLTPLFQKLPLDTRVSLVYRYGIDFNLGYTVDPSSVP